MRPITISINRKGYVHWAIPLLFVVFIFGYVVSNLINSKFLSALALILLGGVSGHLLMQRKKVSFSSAFLLIVGLFVGYALAEKMLSNPLIAFIFFASVAIAYSVEKALVK